MTLHRDGETGSIPIRSDRFFSADSQWYFSTREGAAVGPYATKKTAFKGLNDFIDFLALAKPRVLAIFFKSLIAQASSWQAPRQPGRPQGRRASAR